MKIKIILLFISICLLSCLLQAQNNTSQQQILMLKKFYINYDHIWAVPPKTIPYDVLVKKTDSLNSIYCTPKLRKKAKQWLDSDGGHDLLRDDYYGNTRCRRFALHALAQAFACAYKQQ